MKQSPLRFERWSSFDRSLLQSSTKLDLRFWTPCLTLLLILSIVITDHWTTDRFLPRMSIPPTSGLATFLSNQKSEFLQQVKAGGDLSSWVIANGNEAGGQCH